MKSWICLQRTTAYVGLLIECALLKTLQSAYTMEFDGANAVINNWQIRSRTWRKSQFWLFCGLDGTRPQTTRIQRIPRGASLAGMSNECALSNSWAFDWRGVNVFTPVQTVCCSEPVLSCNGVWTALKAYSQLLKMESKLHEFVAGMH